MFPREVVLCDDEIDLEFRIDLSVLMEFLRKFVVLGLMCCDFWLGIGLCVDDVLQNLCDREGSCFDETTISIA